MIVMREILNVKQTRVHPDTPAKGGSGKHSWASTVRQESELAVRSRMAFAVIVIL